MWIDKQNELSAAQAVTATAISENVIDTNYTGTVPLRDLGNGAVPIYVVVKTNTACTDSGSDATLTVTVESDSAVGLDASATVHLKTIAFAFAHFSVADTVLLVAQLPPGNYERYLGVRYTVASGPLTAGAFDALLTTDPQRWRAYASGTRV